MERMKDTRLAEKIESSVDERQVNLLYITLAEPYEEHRKGKGKKYQRDDLKTASTQSLFKVKMQRVHGPHLASSLVEELYSLPGPLVTTIKVIPGLPQDTSSCLRARPMRSRRDGRRERHASSPEKQLCRAPFVPMSCDSSSADDEGTCKLPLRAKL